MDGEQQRHDDDISWKRFPHYCMMTSSNGNIFRVTGPLCGEFTGPGEFPAQRPVTRSFDVYFDLPELTIEQTAVRLVIWDAISIIMTSA